MNSNTRERLEDERTKHNGNYYEAGKWCALNWVLEEAEKAADMEHTCALSACFKQKKHVLEELERASKAKRYVKEKHVVAGRDINGEGVAVIYNGETCKRENTKVQFYTGVLNGLERLLRY